MNDLEESPNKKEQKPWHYYDERYKEAYLDNPKAGKAAALAKAGYVGDYLPQEANRIHNRLRDQIQAAVTERIQDGGDVGFALLIELANDSDTPHAVRATVASKLLDYAGRKPGDVVTIKREQTIGEIEHELAKLEKQLGVVAIEADFEEVEGGHE